MGPGLVTNFLFAHLPQLQRGGVTFPPFNVISDNGVRVDFLTFIHSAVDGVRNIALLLDGLGGLSSLAPPGALQEFCCIGEGFWLVESQEQHG